MAAGPRPHVPRLCPLGRPGGELPPSPALPCPRAGEVAAALRWQGALLSCGSPPVASPEPPLPSAAHGAGEEPEEGGAGALNRSSVVAAALLSCGSPASASSRDVAPCAPGVWPRARISLSCISALAPAAGSISDPGTCQTPVAPVTSLACTPPGRCSGGGGSGISGAAAATAPAPAIATPAAPAALADSTAAAAASPRAAPCA